jgi:hypothetical protein
MTSDVRARGTVQALVDQAEQTVVARRATRTGDAWPPWLQRRAKRVKLPESHGKGLRDRASVKSFDNEPVG